MTSGRVSVAPLPPALRILTALAMLFLWPGPAWASPAPEAKLLNPPLSFEPNRGQLPAPVQFLSRGPGYALSLAPGEAVLQLEHRRQASGAQVDTVRMSLLGANAASAAAGVNRQPGVVNYLTGSDPARWRSAIPTYAKVRYGAIYPGIDLLFYGNQRQLEYDFVVAPGADPARIVWRIQGARVTLDAVGNALLRTPHGTAALGKPVLYQLEGDRRIPVEGAFAAAGNQLRFRVGPYDHSRALVIDPVLSYASYLAGAGSDTIGTPTGPGILQVGVSQGLALDSAGNVYVTGSTLSLDFPTKTPYQSAPPAKVQGVPPGQWSTAFVSKFSADGSSLIYSTYLGGNGTDRGYAIAVDAAGSAYVTGLTTSPNFPITSGAYQTVCSPIANNSGPSAAASNCNSSDWSVFVTKLNPAGTGLVYSTFLGGYGNWAHGYAIAVDSAGRAYVAGNENEICSPGYTFQSCFPTTTGAVISGTAVGGRSQQYAFVAVFDPAGAHLLYSTLYGDLNTACLAGCGATWATGIAVDGSGGFYLIGETQAGKLPTTAGVIQPTGAPLDTTGVYVLAYRGFVAKFNPVTSAAGASLAWATYLGGQSPTTHDYLSGITLDSAGNIYLAGYTNSKDFPVTSGAYGTICAPNGGTCAAGHVTKLNPYGTSILWSTYVGGAKADGSDALYWTGPIQLDGKGNVYLAAQAGPAFPLINPVEPAVSGGSMQMAVAELDPAGANLLFFTRIGSGGRDTSYPAGLAVDASGNIYLAGNNAGPNLITTPGAFQTSAGSSTCCYHGFVAKIAPTVLPSLQSGTLANGATYLAGGLVPGSWAQVKGTNLASTTRIWETPDFTSLGSKLPTNLSGVQVTVNGQAAAVYYISPTQVSFQVPAGITGTASVQVTVNGQTSNTVAAAAAANSPGIFPVTVNGANYAAGVLLDGKLVGDPAVSSAFRNAVPGDIVQLFATGLAPSPANTTISTTLLNGVTVTIGSVTVPASAAALVAVGEFQVNFTVPPDFASLAPGVYPISISINGVASPASINSSSPGPVVIPIQH